MCQPARLRRLYVAYSSDSGGFGRLVGGASEGGREAGRSAAEGSAEGFGAGGRGANGRSPTGFSFVPSGRGTAGFGAAGRGAAGFDSVVPPSEEIGFGAAGLATGGLGVAGLASGDLASGDVPSAETGFGATGRGAVGFVGVEPSGAGGRGLGAGLGAAGSTGEAVPAAVAAWADGIVFFTGASPDPLAVTTGLGRTSAVEVDGATGRGLPSAETGFAAGFATGFSSGEAGLLTGAVVLDADAAVDAGAVFATGVVGFSALAAGFATSVAGFATADLAADATFFPAPIPTNPLKSGADGASKLIPCGIAGSVSTATFNPENFGAAVGPGMRTRSFGFRMKKNNPPATARHSTMPTMINMVLDALSSAGGAVGVPAFTTAGF